MMHRKRSGAFSTALAVSVFLSGCALDPEDADAELSDQQLGESVQALAAGGGCPAVEPLESGVFATGADEGRIVFTPDGETAYYHVTDENFIYSIMESHFVDGAWSAPVVASFSGHDDFDPFVTSDGQRLYFSSWRGVDGGPPRPDSEIWMMRRTASGWSEPIHLPPPISSPYFENFPSVTADGTLYYNTNRAATTPTEFDGWDIYAARKQGHGFATPQRLGAGINTVAAWEFNPALLDNGRLMVFSSDREGGFGLPDLYASVRVGQTWLPAVNLGPCVNTAAGEFHPATASARDSLTFVRFSDETAGDFYELRLGW
jgi:hypothetical protein